MAFCTQCGAENQAGAMFCTSCGERLEGKASPSILPERLPAAVRDFAVGEKVILGGTGLAVISFFLPWFVVPGWLRSQYVTGIGVLQWTGTVLLEPVIAVGALALLFVTRKSASATRIRAAGWQILLGATFALPGLTALVAPVPFLAGSLSVGWWGFTLGYVAIIVGGFMTLNKLAVSRAG